ncbi:DegT/DnrJ/EryC1/StrS family aminotransferase [Candidatus Daviesbacteria bacterium]|nr:DegT/DnrJ/EryC1/StrS family aminotransferase [Candidatus Daviesbacteria bacterium]
MGKRQVKFNNLVPATKVTKELQNAFLKVLDSGNYILSKNVLEFEEKFAKYLGAKYCIGVGNGLEAIQISLMSLGIGKDDEVITTPISAVATTLAILAVGAIPVFVDTKDDGLINEGLIEKAITKATKAILPVHLYGNSVNLEKIQAICKQYNLYLVEDAAQAHGSSFTGKKLGTFGDLGCFSFYPTKNLGALGDGGAIVTNNKKNADVCREIRDYGQNKKYHHVRFALNSRLDEIQAALLYIKLKSLDSQNNQRRRLAIRYISHLSNIPSLKIVKADNLNNANFHLFVIRAKKRDKLMGYLKRSGVQTFIHFPKIIPDQPFLKPEYGNLSLPNARKFVKEILSLPLYPEMIIDEVDYTSKLIKNFYEPKN